MVTTALKKLNWKASFIVLTALLAISLLLVLVSSHFHSTNGWGSFIGTGILAAGLLFGGWWLLRSEKPPRWLGWLLIGAVLIRLVMGAMWFLTLPVLGHGTSAETAGYVMNDASERDQAAWKLARSNKPLWSAFQNNRISDQYGGLLFFSALIYRYLGSAVHQPLLIVVISAAFASLAVIFTWALARRAWGEKTATLAAWGLALYPEAVLLGSSQMREAFMIPLTAAAFYGLMRYRQDRSRAGLAWMFISVLLFLPLSPLFAALLTGMLALVALAVANRFVRETLRQRWTWFALGGLVLLILAGLWLALKQFTPPGMNNPFEMIGWWVRKSAGLQAYLQQHSSGWIQKVFKNTPEWLHLPLLLAYGMLQPFLPAALIAGSTAPIWPWISAWRSIGWTIVLAFVIYASLLAIRYRNKASSSAAGLALTMSLVAWLSILIASFRGGADLWDNPRYRAVFASLQIALAAWAWVEYRRLGDAWLRRALISFAAILAWFLPWYLRRYTTLTWPVVDVFKTLGLGITTAFLFCVWDWVRTEAKPDKRQHSKSEPVE